MRVSVLLSSITVLLLGIAAWFAVQRGAPAWLSDFARIGPFLSLFLLGRVAWEAATRPSIHGRVPLLVGYGAAPLALAYLSAHKPTSAELATFAATGAQVIAALLIALALERRTALEPLLPPGTKQRSKARQPVAAQASPDVRFERQDLLIVVVGLTAALIALVPGIGQPLAAVCFYFAAVAIAGTAASLVLLLPRTTLPKAGSDARP